MLNLPDFYINFIMEVSTVKCFLNVHSEQSILETEHPPQKWNFSLRTGKSLPRIPLYPTPGLELLMMDFR